MSGRKQRAIVYIDGYNLYYGMRNAFGKKYMWLDLQAFSESLLQPQAEWWQPLKAPQIKNADTIASDRRLAEARNPRCGMSVL